VEVAYADQAYTQISPRQLQRYHLQVRYQPKQWARFTGTFHDVEGRDNIPLVNHLDHNRSGSLGVSLLPSSRYGLDLSYGYSDVFTQTTLCFAATPAPSGPGAGAAPADCGTNTNLGTGYYDAPTHYGSVGVTFTPVKTVHAGAGYSISAVNGNAEFLNPRQVEGSLQSKYQSPYVDLAWTVHTGWIGKASYNHYQYGEEDAVGPTLPRSFQGDVVTVAVRYEF
jgi:opacity protein-like surface antigen